jgi:hypothetical protein
LIPSIGEAARNLDDAVRAIQAAGSRAILVVAKASGWNGSDHPDEASALKLMGSGRAGLHVLARGEDLAECLG